MSDKVVVKVADLPQKFKEVNPHNLYLYCKAFMANQRANSASTKSRSEVRGGGRKPFSQKGGGRARQGSIRVPHFRGGGVVFGPTPNRNYTQKVNKKQKRSALIYALYEKVQDGKLFIVDKIFVESGKTKDAKRFVDGFNQKSILVVKGEIDEKTYLAFRNLKESYLIEPNALNGYVVATYSSIAIEKAVWEKLIKES
jgi:large subunit ribosomal protein L4